MVRKGHRQALGPEKNTITFMHESPGRDCGKSCRYHHPNQEKHLNKLVMRHIDTNKIVFP